MCTRCSKDLPLAQFALLRMDSQGLPIYRSLCEPCKAQEARAARTAQRPASHVRRDRAKEARKYGMTLEGYDVMRADMLTRQGGTCAVCQAAPATDLDHDHATGAIRGLLCHWCNVAAGFLRDSPERCRSLAVYLERNAPPGRS